MTGFAACGEQDANQTMRTHPTSSAAKPKKLDDENISNIQKEAFNCMQSLCFHFPLLINKLKIKA